MSATKKTKQNKAKSVLARNVSKLKSVRRLKSAGPVLNRLLELTNLAPKDARLPDVLVEEDIERRLEQGKKPLVSTVEIEAAITNLPEKLAEYLMKELQEAIRLDFPEFAQAQRVLAIYRRILRTRSALYEIVRLIQNEEIGYLRECECGRVFFAGRKDKFGCSDVCNANRRKEKWKNQYSKGNPSYFKLNVPKRSGPRQRYTR